MSLPDPLELIRAEVGRTWGSLPEEAQKDVANTFDSAAWAILNLTGEDLERELRAIKATLACWVFVGAGWVQQRFWRAVRAPMNELLS